MGALAGCSLLLAAALSAADEGARTDAGFDTVGVFTELGTQTDLIPLLKASGYTAYEALDGGFARRPDLHDAYYAGVARGLDAAREAGLDAYVILLTNMAQCTGPEEFREATAFSPKDAALVAERMTWLRAAVRRLRDHADGFIVFAGDPGGDPERATTVEDFIAFAAGVRDIVAQEAPDARFIVNTWAVAAWDGFPSPFTTEFWDKEVRLTREVMAREDLVAPGVVVEFPMHNYYRSLALTTHADEGREPERYPTAADAAALKARGVRDIWGWPYFLVDECDDGYSGRTWGHAQAETRYLHKTVQEGRALGLTGMVGNVSINGMDVEALNLYAFGRFCNDPEATPAAVVREFAAALAEEVSVADLVQVISFLENRSSWEAGLPEGRRLPPLPCALGSPQEALAALQTVAPLAQAGLPLRESPEAYLKRLAGRLRTLADAARSEGNAAAVRVYETRSATLPTIPDNAAQGGVDADGLTLTAGMGDGGDWGFGAAGARMVAPPKLSVEVALKGAFRRVDVNTAAAIVVDYCSPSGYLKRGSYEVGPSSPDRTDFVPGWGRGAAPDVVRRVSVPEDGRLELDLEADAPIGWDGRVWLTALAENTGRGTELQVRVPGAVEATEEPPAEATAPFAAEPIEWALVPLAGRTLATGPLEGPAAIALTKLQERLPVAPAPASDGRIEGPALLVGLLDDLRPQLGAQADAFADELADDLPWRREQGYILHYDAEADRLIATALATQGLTYATAHLQRCAVDAPVPAIAMERLHMAEKPRVEERGVYINIGYGLSAGPLTVDNWAEAEWERFIDDLVLSRATFWSWYLWTEIEHVYPGSTPDHAEKNAHVHAMLRHAIDYSRRRGLRAVHLFTPTTIPADMVAAHPGWATTLEYVNSGGICSRVPEAYQAALDVHRNQMLHFRNASEYDIAFYDPGGCMCETCRQGDVQLGELLKQIRDFAAIKREINPDARFGFWTWAVWRYERIHGYSLKGRLIPEAARLLGDLRERTVVIDSFHGDAGSEPYFEEAKRHGFRTSNFLYQTNIEDGYVLLLPLLTFQRQWAALTQERALDETFLMIMEVGSKYPMAHFGAEFFWDASLTPSQATGRFALQATGNLEAAAALQRGLLALDRLTYLGALTLDDFTADVRAMREGFEAAFAQTGPERGVVWGRLLTMARAYDLLFEAVEHRARGAREDTEALRAAYVETLRADPQFSLFAERFAAEKFDQYVGWLANGFRQGYF